MIVDIMAVNIDQYKKIVFAFRDVGYPNFKQVADLVGIHRVTIRKVWEYGIDPENAPPIKDLNVFSPQFQEPLCMKYDDNVSSTPSQNDNPTYQNDSSEDLENSPVDGPTLPQDPPVSPQTHMEQSIKTPLTEQRINPPSRGGLSDKQFRSRGYEEDAVLASMQAIVGSTVISVNTLKALQKHQDAIIGTLAGMMVGPAFSPAGVKEMMGPVKEFMLMIKSISEGINKGADSLTRLMAASRLHAGQAAVISEHRHTHTMGTGGADTSAADARSLRMRQLAAIHARSLQPDPEYHGEEHGMTAVDADFKEVNEE